MVLSPTARTLLTALVAALAVIAVALPTLGAPLWVGVIVGALSAFFGALGIVPPQVGGQQVGLTNPSVVNQPADNFK